ncbi:MAG: hypothetical protein ACOZE5_00405 [Verrucomicrobiota bacterium]
MKAPSHTFRFAPVLLALALSVGSPVLFGEESAEKKLTKNQQQYDADKDGKLSDEEKAAAREAAKAKAKETREGKLDKEERAQKKADEEAAREARKAEREAKKAEKAAEK